MAREESIVVMPRAAEEFGQAAFVYCFCVQPDIVKPLDKDALLMGRVHMPVLCGAHC